MVMLYMATTSFSGNQISMAKGKVGEISDPALVADLTKAGYIVPFESTAAKAEKAPAQDDEADKPKTKRKGK